MTVGFIDGFTGTGAVDDSSISVSDTTLGIDTLSLTDSLTIVPKGARFTTAGITTMRTVTATQNSTQYTLDMTAPSAGTFTVTHNSNTTAALAYDLTASAFQTALEGLASIGSGNVTVTESTDVYTITFAGTLANTAQTITVDGTGLTASNSHVLTQTQDGTSTWMVTFTPAIATGSVPSDDDAIQFYPQKVEMKVGEGNVEHTETQEAVIDTDRGILDGVRAGTDQPMTWSASFVYNWLRASSGDPITVYEAIYQLGDASTWVTSSTDKCEPYQLDFFVLDRPSCGSEEAEVMLFRYSRITSVNPSVEAASVSIEATCNSLRPDVSRVTNSDDVVEAALAPAA